MKIIFWIFLIIFNFSLQASEVSLYLQKEEIDFGQKVTDLVKNYDIRGFATARFIPIQKKVNLPLTNMSYDHVEWKDHSRPKIKSINVIIFTILNELPPSFYMALDRLSSDHEVKATAELEKMNPNEIQELKVDYIKEAKKVFNSIWPQTQKTLIILLSGIMVLIFLGHFLRARQFKRLSSEFNQSIQSLTKNFEKMTEGFDSSPREKGSTKSETKDFALLNNDPLKFQDKDVDFFNAILSDCYWSEEDRYAAYIWTQMPFLIRTKFLVNSERWSDYIHYISSLDSVDLGLDGDVTYLNPLSINHINNIELSRIVVSESHIFPRLSQLRIKNLSTTIEEKIQLLSNSKWSSVKKEFDLTNYPPSIKRKIKSLRTLDIASVEEEEILLKKDLGIELKEAIPSLAWILELEESQIISILAQYNAKELAEAWIAPRFVLEKVASYLPEKRKNLLENYLQKINPSRRSSTFKEIHQTTIRELKLRYGERPQEKKLNAV
jgi:hypothetical protein